MSRISSLYSFGGKRPGFHVFLINTDIQDTSTISDVLVYTSEALLTRATLT